MHELYTPARERGTPAASLAPQAARLAPAPARRGLGRQRRGGQSMDAARPGQGPGSPATSPPSRCFPALVPRTAGSSARLVAPGRRSGWLPGAGLDPQPDDRGEAPGVWPLLPSRPCGPLAQGDTLEPAKARPPRQAARRSRDGAGAAGDLAGHQQGAQAQGQRLFCIDESGGSPLPRVVRTYAPVGQTPILPAWWTRDQLAALAAISPEGKLYFHSQ